MGTKKMSRNLSCKYRPSRKHVIVVSGLLTIFLLFCLIKVPSRTKTPKAGKVVQVSVSDPNLVIYDHPSYLETEIDQPALVRRAQTIRTRWSSFRRKTPTEMQETKEYCSQFSQRVQLMEERCIGYWLYHLRHAKIVNITKYWGFRDTHFGAITLELEGGFRAMFKPCTSPEEDTSKEVVASYLDQLLGWGQTAPVITRTIPVSVLEELTSDDEVDREVFSKTLQECTYDRGLFFIGPMIGWWENLIPIRTIRKSKADIPTLLAYREELEEFPLAAQMQSKFHVFYLLINILRHGKDEFITNTGDLVSLDLDRARFRGTREIAQDPTNFSWCHICYMDRWVYNLFVAVGPLQPEKYRLGSLMSMVMEQEDIYVGAWSDQMGETLDTRVRMLLQCMDECVMRYGEDNVLISPPVRVPPKEIVQWFVDHSEYKNHNGRQGPEGSSWLDAL